MTQGHAGALSSACAICLLTAAHLSTAIRRDDGLGLDDACVRHGQDPEACLREKGSDGQRACLFRSRPKGCVPMLPVNCPGTNNPHCQGMCEWEWTGNWTTSCKAKCAAWQGDAATCNAAGSCLFRSQPFGCVDMKPENCPGVKNANCKGVCMWKNEPSNWEKSCKAKCSAYTGNEAACRAAEGCLFAISKDCIEMLPENCPSVDSANCKGVCRWENDQGKSSCHARCQAWKANDRMCNAAGSCLFRSKPFGCTNMEPQNCAGVNRTNCKGICVWEDVPNKWYESCKAKSIPKPTLSETCLRHGQDPEACLREKDSGGQHACLFRSHPKGCVPMLPVNCPGTNSSHCQGMCEWEWTGNWATSCKAKCAALQGDAATCNAAGSCLFRSQPFGCVDMKPENCPGVNNANCKGVCMWKNIPGHWEKSCRAKAMPKPGPKPKPADRTAARKGKGTNWAAIVAVGALVVILCIAGCWFCGGSRNRNRTGSPPASVWEMAWAPITVEIPPEVQPGQGFQFTHPRTGQQMQAIAPMDGARVITLQC